MTDPISREEAEAWSNDNGLTFAGLTAWQDGPDKYHRALRTIIDLYDKQEWLLNCIETWREEEADWKAENERLRVDLEPGNVSVGALLQEAARLKAENERLRAAFLSALESLKSYGWLIDDNIDDAIAQFTADD